MFQTQLFQKINKTWKSRQLYLTSIFGSCIVTSLALECNKNQLPFIVPTFKMANIIRKNLKIQELEPNSGASIALLFSHIISIRD